MLEKLNSVFSTDDIDIDKIDSNIGTFFRGCMALLQYTMMILTLMMIILMKMILKLLFILGLWLGFIALSNVKKAKKDRRRINAYSNVFSKSVKICGTIRVIHKRLVILARFSSFCSFNWI